MFPIRDDIPSKKFPIVNTWLIVVNVLCFAYEYQLGPGLKNFIFQYGFIPLRFLQEQQTAPLDPSRFLPVFSSMFLHGGFLHIIGNMWVLYIFGDNVEDCMGHSRYFTFYILCGMAAVVMQTVADPGSRTPMIGASGAISGVLGAYLLTYPKARILTLLPLIVFFYLVEIPAYVFLILWFLIQFLQGTHQLMSGSLAKGGVAFWAHVGGFVTGALLIFFFRNRRRGSFGTRLHLR